jgi:hypothetical protein
LHQGFQPWLKLIAPEYLGTPAIVKSQQAGNAVLFEAIL